MLELVVSYTSKNFFRAVSSQTYMWHFTIAFYDCIDDLCKVSNIVVFYLQTLLPLFVLIVM